MPTKSSSPTAAASPTAAGPFRPAVPRVVQGVGTGLPFVVEPVSVIRLDKDGEPTGRPADFMSQAAACLAQITLAGVDKADFLQVTGHLRDRADVAAWNAACELWLSGVPVRPVVAHIIVADFDHDAERVRVSAMGWQSA